MAIPVTVADINAFTNQHIVPKMTDVVYKESPLFVRMINKQKVFPGGTSIQRPIGYAKLNGAAYSKGENFNTTYVQTDAAFDVSMKSYYVNVTLYGLDGVTNRGPEAAFSQAEVKMANASMRMAELIARDIYGDGQTSAADVATSGEVLSTTKQLDGLLAWIDDGSTSSAAVYSTATDVTKCFPTIGGLTRSDLFNSAPAFGSATATPAAAIGGANAYTERAFTAFTLADVNKACGAARFGNKFVDLIMVTQNGWNKFWNAIQPNQRFQEESSDLAKIGFQSMRFNQSVLVVDQYMPEQMALGVNSDFVEFYVTSDPRYQFGFTGFKEAQNTDNLAGQYLFAGNMIVPSPRCNFKLVGSALA
jgi:hypothetical protein